MKISNFNLYINGLIALIIVNALVLLNLDLFYLRAVITFLFISFWPGYLLFSIFKIKNNSMIKSTMYMVGLSYSFIIIYGLLINYLLPLIGINSPLQTFPVVLMFDLGIIILMIINYYRTPHVNINKIPEFDNINRVILIISIILPFLSIIGTELLNFTDNNLVTIIMLGIMFILLIAVFILRKKIDKRIFPWIIFMISLSLLFSVSLRSNYIFGSDIFGEYSVFQATKNAALWSPINSRIEAYNACLSVTIFPTILNVFINISDQMLFKIIFPIIISLLSVIVYYIFKLYSKNDYIVFLSVIFFMAFPSYSLSTPMHIRQGMAFIFFALAVLILLDPGIDYRLKQFLFVIFGVSTILSHYSTAYIALFLFLFVFIIGHIYTFFRNKFLLKKKNKLIDNLRSSKKLSIGVSTIFIIFLFAIVWFYSITGIASGAYEVAGNVVSNLNLILNDNVKAEGVSLTEQFNIFGGNTNRVILERQLLTNYSNDIYRQLRNDPDVKLYSPSDTASYRTFRTSLRPLPSNINSKYSYNIYVGIDIIRKLVKVFIIVGVIYFLSLFLKNKFKDMEYLLLMLGASIILALTMILPFFSISYELDRVFQQCLIILAFPAIIGGLFLLRFVKKIDIAVISGIFIIYLLFSTGLISQFIGNSTPVIQLNNAGEDYVRFYLHKSDAKAMGWLEKNYDGKSQIYAGGPEKSKLSAITGITATQTAIFPSVIDKNSYVFASQTNLLQGVSYVTAFGNTIPYNFPDEFLQSRKNEIYNSGGSAIYK